MTRRSLRPLLRIPRTVDLATSLFTLHLQGHGRNGEGGAELGGGDPRKPLDATRSGSFAAFRGTSVPWIQTHIRSLCRCSQLIPGDAEDWRKLVNHTNVKHAST